jgi:hypothetical protein
MSRLSPLLPFRFAGALAGAFFSASSILAQVVNSVASSPNQTVDFALTLLPGERIGEGQVVRGSFSLGTNEFMFVLPEDVRVQQQSTGTITLTSRDRRYFLSIRNVGAETANAELKDALQKWIAGEYPHAGSLEEFSTTVADRTGAGFQLRYKVPGIDTRLVRIIWVPFKAGVLEFALNTDINLASAAQGAMDAILLTFRSNERGKIEITRRSAAT